MRRALLLALAMLLVATPVLPVGSDGGNEHCVTWEENGMVYVYPENCVWPDGSQYTGPVRYPP